MSEDGSDDSPPRPKRKIKKVVVLSSSDSESDGSISVAGTRRKRLRVLSDEEASDSSGSSVVRAGTRRRRTLPKLRDSEAESDSSGWSTEHADSSRPVTSASKPISGFASDSSEGNSDKCSICLLRFKEQEVGTPESCEHIFCLDCITEWSKNVNTCPVDRMTFNSIIVKACVGGRVLRKEPVKVIERRPSVEALVVEDPTVCEICGSIEDEETMLLCDGCDLGYHMQCLSPPLSEVPADQWLCPNCYVSLNGESNLLEDINLSEVEDLLEGVVDIDLPLGPRSVLLRQQRNVRRSSRNAGRLDQPSTSSGGHGNSNNINELSVISRGSTISQRSSRTTNRRQAITKRRKYKRRRTKTVIIEYEVQENGKFPITKRVKKKVKRRRVKKRQPRTAARRSYVRASVRAKLATLKTDQRPEMVQASNANRSNLSVQRQRAGIPSLRLYGNPNELDYFSDDENANSEEASTAVATRSTSNILSAYRQARRKMIMVPSPPHASSAPDILSNILESQTLLHSKKSIISISVDGNVDYKIQSHKENQEKKNVVTKNEEKLDLSKANETVRNVPSYPGQNRGGGWGGGYRGNYHREQNSNNFNRGGNYENNYGGNYQNRQGNTYNYQNNNMRRDDTDYYDNFSRRPQQYSNTDDAYFDRSRRPGPMDNNRGSNYSNHQRPNDQSQGRFSLGPSWQPYGGGGPSAPTPRQDVPPTQSRHSFGGFENPVDMRMGQVPPTNTNTNSEMFSGIETREEKTQPHAYHPLPDPQAYQPMMEPPVFNYQKNSEVEKSEDEKSDSGLVIDTEKYDPTEPTHDDDSGDDEPIESQEPEILPPPAVQSILAGIDTSAMNVPPNILDTAVRQVLKEHRNLIVPQNAETHDRSDDDSDGDCPNFSIYSATSVHIANNSSSLTDEVPQEQPQDSLEDLVQEDDETPPSTSPITISETVNNEKKADVSRTSTKPLVSNYDMDEKKKSEEEYKEKVSKRCPITTNTRNPIKIKLNTSSLIKRQVSLYDEEDTSQDVDANEKSEVTKEMPEEKISVNCQKKFDESEKKKSPSPEKCDLPLESNEITKSSNPLLNNIIDKDSSEKQEQIIKESVDDKDDDNKCENIGSNSPLDKSEVSPVNKEESDEECHSDGDDDVPIIFTEQSPKLDLEVARVDDNVEKMTESISETEDERSYTPCLDENKSNKDASFETEKDKGLEGLDTEMISEEEGNEMFSENERAASEISRGSPTRVPLENEEGEIADKKKEAKKVSLRDEGAKKKKKKESKKDVKEKSKSRKKSEISFKKLSKSGKERNYRERDKNEKRSERERRDSGDGNESRQRRRKEKRKDLERYDVRTVVTEKRRKQKDPFGRDVSPRGRSPSLSPPPRSPSPAPSRRRRTASRHRRSSRRSLSKSRRSASRGRRSLSRIRRSPSPSRRSLSRRRSPPGRRSVPRRTSIARGRSPARSRASLTRARRSVSSLRRRSGTPRASPRRRSPPRRKRRRSGSRVARRRSVSASPPRRTNKKKKRTRSARRAPAAVSPERKRRRSASRQAEPEAPSPISRPPSPRTPPPEPEPEPRPPLRSDDEPERRERRRRDPDRQRRRVRDAAGPSKEVFTSGDNILVSVSFKEQERGEEGDRRRRRETRRDRRRRRRAAVAPEVEVAKPVAIIDLERSPFRELTPSPKNVIVLSDSDHGEREGAEAGAPPAPEPEPAPEPAPPALGPKTPPEPTVPEPAAPEPPERPDEQAEAAGSERQSPDAYDPFEPTRSASASPASASPASPAPAPAPPSPPRALITLEAAQRSNLSADEVLDRRPLTPVEKVMALLQSTRDASPEPADALAEPPPAPAPRIVLPSPTRVPPKLFPGKPSPIKSNPVKPMQALRLQRPPSDGGASPYSPGSSDFGELFEPPPRRVRAASKVPVRLDRKKGKTQVGVKIDEENLKILDDLPSSAVEMQVKSKMSVRAQFLKKLNRQERVVEEVKLVLKPHYNKKRVTKEEYKDILRRAVPKICHNKSGEINPTKIQALVEAYVKKFRKKHKLGMA
nr:PHD and RING finger domain-containing protein 1 isoform X1 [Vanessa tameamea]XP_026501799.1 PHD and RING finger domain-containing protein 1 isoform X1 [Vanessa tameamea]XP_026501800.1 PHD and RING finger domain-containing protein 1 isoform X1 [Vanessa tameamea]